MQRETYQLITELEALLNPQGKDLVDFASVPTEVEMIMRGNSILQSFEMKDAGGLAADGHGKVSDAHATFTFNNDGNSCSFGFTRLFSEYDPNIGNMIDYQRTKSGKIIISDIFYSHEAEHCSSRAVRVDTDGSLSFLNDAEMTPFQIHEIIKELMDVAPRIMAKVMYAPQQEQEFESTKSTAS